MSPSNQRNTLGIALVAVAAACATVDDHNPFAPAETLAQNGYAAAGLGVIYLELTRDVIADLDTSPEVDRALALAAESVHTPLQALLGALRVYDAAREENAPSERVDATAEAVIAALNNLRPALFNLVAAVNAARRGDQP